MYDKNRRYLTYKMKQKLEKSSVTKMNRLKFILLLQLGEKFIHKILSVFLFIIFLFLYKEKKF